VFKINFVLTIDSYVNGACYMKHTKSAELITAGNVWTAELIGTQTSVKVDEFTCINGEANGKTYTATNGGKYKIECGIDYAGGDLLTVDSTTTFQTCMDACDATTGCIDVSWVWGSCYLKNEVNTASELSHVWTGRQIKVDELTCVDGESNGKTYTAKNGGKYQVECGIDYAGGDLLTVDSMTTFQTCMDACDATTGCIDVSWVTGSCYLKNELTTALELSHVSTGRRVDTDNSPVPDKDTATKTGVLSCRYGSSFAIGVTNTDTQSYLGRIKLHQSRDYETAGVDIESFVPKTDATAAWFRFSGAGILEDDETRGTAAFYWADSYAKMKFGGVQTAEAQGSCWRSTAQTDVIECSSSPGADMFNRMSTCPNSVGLSNSLPGTAVSAGITSVLQPVAGCNSISFSIEDEVCNPAPEER
jgi:predicted heme/steroid binding protein